jgi:hypothetical protein
MQCDLAKLESQEAKPCFEGISLQKLILLQENAKYLCARRMPNGIEPNLTDFQGDGIALPGSGYDEANLSMINRR